MKLHISLDVKNLNDSVKFYSTLFATEPAKVKPGYAKFDVSEPGVVLSLVERHDLTFPLAGPNHLGVRVPDLDQVLAAKARLESAGYVTSDEMGTTCCYAVQDKIWATDPNGYRWETYVFHGDAEVFASTKLLEEGCKCCGTETCDTEKLAAVGQCCDAKETQSAR
jgi:catechol 2,3-dioxygenase-like lactoylglutathione lyase family enzyme